MKLTKESKENSKREGKVKDNTETARNSYMKYNFSLVA